MGRASERVTLRRQGGSSNLNAGILCDPMLRDA